MEIKGIFRADMWFWGMQQQYVVLTLMRDSSGELSWQWRFGDKLEWGLLKEADPTAINTYRRLRPRDFAYTDINDILDNSMYGDIIISAPFKERDLLGAPYIYNREAFWTCLGCTITWIGLSYAIIDPFLCLKLLPVILLFSYLIIKSESSLVWK